MKKLFVILFILFPNLLFAADAITTIDFINSLIPEGKKVLILKSVEDKSSRPCALEIAADQNHTLVTLFVEREGGPWSAIFDIYKNSTFHVLIKSNIEKNILKATEIDTKEQDGGHERQSIELSYNASEIHIRILNELDTLDGYRMQTDARCSFQRL